MRWKTRASAFVLLPLALASAAAIARAADFDAWYLSRGTLRTLGAPRESSLPVGSLQKPFISRAWARSHPEGVPPIVHCRGGSMCWRPSGHGALGLRAAL